MLPRVADVLDRLTLANPTAEAALAQQLTAAVTDVCQAQGLTPDPAAIDDAVQAHLTEGALPANVETGATWGWKRPASEDERRRRQNVHLGQRFLIAWGRFYHEDEEKLAAFVLILASLLGSIFVGGTVGDFIPRAGWDLLVGLTTFLGSLVVLMTVLLGMPIMAFERQKDLEETAPSEKALQRWLAYPVTRQAARQCLDSAVPYLMHGDVRHINDLADQAEAEAKVGAAQQANRERMQTLRTQLQEDPAPSRPSFPVHCMKG